MAGRRLKESEVMAGRRLKDPRRLLTCRQLLLEGNSLGPGCRAPMHLAASADAADTSPCSLASLMTFGVESRGG